MCVCCACCVSVCHVRVRVMNLGSSARACVVCVRALFAWVHCVREFNVSLGRECAFERGIHE